jgi:polyphosphate:AMP phosphotransferase
MNRAEGTTVTEKHDTAPDATPVDGVSKTKTGKASSAATAKRTAQASAVGRPAKSNVNTAVKTAAKPAAKSATKTSARTGAGTATRAAKPSPAQPPADMPAANASPAGVEPATAPVTPPKAEVFAPTAPDATVLVAEPVAPAQEAGLTASISQDPADTQDSDDLTAQPPKDFAPDLSGEDTPPIPEGADMDALRNRLMTLQQQVRAAGIPVVILFEGWDASGKGTLLSKLIEGLDPRSYQVYPVRKLTDEERAWPAMRRYCVNLPEKGNISLFCGSWYREVSNACFESKAARRRLNQAYDEIVSLESQLVSDGALLIKFFLHIPRKEQKARLKELESHKSTRWRVEKEDWEQNERYEEYLRLYDAMIARTHFDGALWHVLRSDNKRTCVQQIYDTVLESFEAALQDRAEGARAWDLPYLQHLESMNTAPIPQLDSFDPEQALSDPYKPAIDKAQKQLGKLQNELYRRSISMVIGFEGWDAAGKGGVVRRLSSALDARGFDVIPISAPTPIEKAHHHLWRFWAALPRDGHIAIFDRTWYGRVLVERIEGFCTEAQWKRAYEEINRFEAEIATHGTVLVKFWLHIDSETQLTRFHDREHSPDKQWKITEDDWRNRDKWPAYAVAVNDMLQKTNTAAAPWTVVEANNKQYARLKVLQTVIHAAEVRLEAEKD